MSSYTYPIRQTEGNLTPEQVHLLLANPTVVARRIAELTKMKFVADYLLASTTRPAEESSTRPGNRLSQKISRKRSPPAPSTPRRS